MVNVDGSTFTFCTANSGLSRCTFIDVPNTTFLPSKSTSPTSYHSKDVHLNEQVVVAHTIS